MEKFIRDLFLFSIPLIVYLLVILCIDPYNYLGNHSLIKSQKKSNIANTVEPHLFKLINFENHPKRNVVLGDSRSNGLYGQIQSDKWANMSYGGASLEEIIDTFWWITERWSADTILVGINLNLYNKYNRRFWIQETIARKSNFFSYAFSKYTFKSAWLYLKSAIKKEDYSIRPTHSSKEEFWSYQVENVAEKFYKQFDYPDNYFSELQKMAQHCENNNTKLIFWIPPSHIDFQNRKKDFGLMKYDSLFKNDLNTLGCLYHFDYPSELTLKDENFNDPLHFKPEIASVIYQEIFQNRPFFSKYSGKKNQVYFNN